MLGAASRGHPDSVCVVEEGVLEGDPLKATVRELLQLGKEGDAEAILGLSAGRIPGNRIGQAPPPDLTAAI